MASSFVLSDVDINPLTDGVAFECVCELSDFPLAINRTALTADGVAAVDALVLSVAEFNWAIPAPPVLAVGSLLVLKMPLVILEAGKLGILALENVPAFILDASILGILDVLKVPAVILEASKLGIRASPSVPLVILDAAKLGMRAVLKAPALIFDAFKLGMRASANVPLVISLADSDGDRATHDPPTLSSVLYVVRLTRIKPS